MANTTTIILKNSGTTGNTPTAANLEFGELALNYADGLLFYKAANGAVLNISGSGNATGNGQAAFDQANLAFAQANIANTIAIAAFDTANTKYTQNSSLLQVVDTAEFTTGNVGTIRSNIGGINLISNNFVQLQYNPDSFASENETSNSSWVYVDNNGIVIEAQGSSAQYYSAIVLDKNLSQTAIYSKSNSFIFSGNSLFFPDGSNQVTAYKPIVFDIANAAFTQANSANIIASSAFDKANVANVIASAAYNQANSANVIASAAFGKANSANVIASGAYDKANSANIVAAAAFSQANTAYSSAVLKTGNTMTGQLIMSVGTASSSQNTGSIVVNGGVGISGNIYISNASSYGFANTSNVSVAKIQYNAACNSIDFVFG